LHDKNNMQKTNSVPNPILKNRIMKSSLLLSFTLLAAALGFSQAPGGVSSGLQLWLKADAGTSTTTDGALVSSWADQSTVGNDASQSSSSAQPIFKTNQFNGHPALRNASGKYFDVDLSAANDQSFTVFTVVKRESDSDEQYVIGIQASDDDDGFNFGYLSSEEIAFDQYGNIVIMDCPAYGGASEIPSILFTEFGTATGKKEYLVRDGVSTDKKNTNTTSFYMMGDGNIGRGNGDNSFIGLMAEVILYDRLLTETEKRRVQTYLCVKYGLSIPVSQNMYYSNGSYPHDLFGIGVSSSQGLNQTVSASINNDDVLDIYGASSLDDGDFLIAGNNDGAISFSAYGGSHCALNEVLGRTWNLSRTGDPGTVTLRFDLTGVSGFDPSQLMLLVDMDGDGFDDEIGLAGSYGAPYFEVLNVALPTNARVTIATGISNWYAVVSGNTTDAIWSPTISGAPQTLPSFCDKSNLSIKSGVTVNNTWSTLSCNKMTVASGAVFNAGTGTVNIHNTLSISGAFNAQTASIVMKGSAAQTISGAGIFNAYNFILDNASGVTIAATSGGARIRNYVYVNAGVLNTNGKLTLISDATSTGMIAPLTTGSINGSVTVQRYSNRTAAGWYMLGSAIQNATVQDWNDDLVTTGFAGSDFPPPGYTFNNVKYYNETLPGGVNDGFVGVSNISETLQARKGYFVYMNAGVMNLDVTGTIYSGTQNMPVTYTSTGSPANDGWNFLSNPYPCTIDWNSANWTKTNMNNAVYVWNPATNQYASYVGGVGTNGGSRYIPSSQSFFVVANAASPALVLQENCKSLVQGTYRSGDEPDEVFTLSIAKGDYYDETSLVLNSYGTLNFESDIDAYKLRSPMTEVPYLSTISEGGHDLSINSFAAVNDGAIIPLRMEVGETGDYTISHRGMEIFANGACMALEDLLTGTVYPLNQYSEISLHLSAGNNDLRFQLRIGATRITQTNNSGCKGLNNGSSLVHIDSQGPYDLTWFNQMGEEIHSAQGLTSDYELSGLKEGIYTLQIQNNGVCGTTESIFYIGVEDEIVAEPIANPSACPDSEDGEIILNLIGGDGNYSVVWSNGAKSQNLVGVPSGVYTAFVMDSKGCKQTVLVNLPSHNNIVSSFETTMDTYELKNGAASVDFFNTSENATTFKWSFGDVTIDSYETNPTHVFNNVGVYQVSMTAANSDCETISTKSIKIARPANGINEFASEIIGTITDEGAKLMFFFNEPRKLKISAYNVLGQQLIEPIVGVYDRQTVQFSERRYASNALIEVLDLNSGERTVVRLGK